MRSRMAQDLHNKWRTGRGNGALPNVAMKDGPVTTVRFFEALILRAWRKLGCRPQARSHCRGHCNEKLTERLDGDMQNQLAEFKLGRIVLHLLCSCQDKNFPWHWRGIVREISQGSLLVWPTSKCDATERCSENETETDSDGNRGGSRTENHSCLKTMKTEIPLIALLMLMCLHAPRTLGQLQRPLPGLTIGQSLRNAATVTHDRSAGNNAILAKLQSFSE